jgi:hypothetical protein
MDLFTGAVGSGQVHDLNPGIRPSGLFWVQPVSRDALMVDLEEGEASLALKDMDEEDFHNLRNALINGPSDPASVTLEMRWNAIAGPISVTDPVHRFTGRFRLCSVQIEWSATVPGFRFMSDPASTTVNVRSVIGREHNGVFFDE